MAVPVYWPVPPFPADTRAPGRHGNAVPPVYWPVPPFPADTRAPGQHCACILAGAALPCRHEGARSTLCLLYTGRCRPSLPTRGRPVNAVPVYWPVPPFPADTRAPGQRCACIRLAGAALPCRHEGARSWLCLYTTGRCRPSLPTRRRPVNAVPVYWPVPPFPADTRAPGRPVNTVPVYWPVPPFPADTRAPGHGCACILAGAALPCRHEGARSTLCLLYTGRCRPSLPTRGRPVNAVPPVYWPVPPFPADTRAPGQHCACILAGAALPCRHEGARSWLCLYTTGRCRPSPPTRGRPVNAVPVYDWPVPPFPADTRAPGQRCACLLAGAALPCRHEGAR